MAQTSIERHTCCICIESIDNDTPFITLPHCEHKLHSNCFIKYVDYNMRIPTTEPITCPICRAQLLERPLPIRLHVELPNNNPHNRGVYTEIYQRRMNWYLYASCACIGFLLLLIYRTSLLFPDENTDDRHKRVT